MYSAALCRGLIEAVADEYRIPLSQAYSAALCRGLIEARTDSVWRSCRATRIPRLYAAASLKLPSLLDELRCVREYSAALCRGLIEARCDSSPLGPGHRGYSAALCRGLIEAGR